MKQKSGYKSSLLVAALTIAALSGCVEPTASPSQTGLAKATAFIGEWCNKDFNTPNITRVHIRQVGNDLRVHMWGRCHPTECDWDEVTATIQENGELLAVTWDQSFVVRTQKLRLQPDDTLAVSTHSHYTDKSGRIDSDSTDQFTKGVVHDWSDQPTEQRH